MRVGVIGAGPIGASLARKLAASGHSVRLANSKNAASLADLASELGVAAVDKEKAVEDVDAIILAIPFGRFPDLAPLLSNVPENVPLIDTSNYYAQRDGSIAAVEAGEVEALWVSDQIGRPVIKAWNAVLADTLAGGGQPENEPGRFAIPVAGDDAAAKAIAIELVRATGFDGVDAGGLAESWRLQPGTPAWCTELTSDALTAALSNADRDRAPRNCEALMEGYVAGAGKLTHDDIIALHRSVTA